MKPSLTLPDPVVVRSYLGPGEERALAATSSTG
ncbi:MAG: hypothetical protein QOD44_3843 [Solirubrobacteraceae bacterium]|nr:hypothetical protein [Solirubrobacteraceae bacterium]